MATEVCCGVRNEPVAYSLKSLVSYFFRRINKFCHRNLVHLANEWPQLAKDFFAISSQHLPL
jgi:hypothetical protein